MRVKEYEGGQAMRLLKGNGGKAKGKDGALKGRRYNTKRQPRRGIRGANGASKDRRWVGERWRYKLGVIRCD
jgi:hypothetical protein